jgi:hypothetical protein
VVETGTSTSRPSKELRRALGAPRARAVHQQQGEISGLSRSVSNLGSSLGTAIAGTILVAGMSSAVTGAQR